jgi:eukaryotic-like serine/threonine-protein kinase
MSTPTDRWNHLKDAVYECIDRSAGERQNHLEAVRAQHGYDASFVAEANELLAQSTSRLEAIDKTPSVDRSQEAAGIPARIGKITAPQLIDLAGVADNAKADALANPVANERIGTTVGAYTIDSLQGRGGMGDVYRAHRSDASFDRVVAIKIIRTQGNGNQAKFAKHFIAERKILASLAHPNIAQVLDAGATEDGTLYLVMEFVDGVPIDEYCNARQLDAHARLKLFATVCDAVQHAHSKLVIHRDIKPSNILVSANGEVKLLDFGIAKLIGENLISDDDGTHGASGAGPSVAHVASSTSSSTPSSSTAFDARALTPEYASPEQFLGEGVSTASDIYSLGVLLYRLLTGASPYAANRTDMVEFVKAVCETPPTLPSRVVTTPNQNPQSLPHKLSPKTLQGDVDSILVKALQKLPQDRYGTASDFAADLRNHLECRPVLARTDSWRYRTGKFVQRNLGTTVAAVAISLALVSLTVYSVWQTQRARQEQARAQKHFDSVRGLANSFMFDVYRELNKVSNSTKAREMLVTTSLKYLDELSGESKGDAKLQLELAQAYRSVADIQGQQSYGNTGKPVEALANLDKAAALLRAHLELEPNSLLALHDAALVYSGRWHLLFGAQKLEEADKTSEESVRYGARLLAAHPKDLKARRIHAGMLLRHSYALVMRGKFDEAIATALKAEAPLKALQVEYPDNIDVATQLASMNASVGLYLAAKPRSPEQAKTDPEMQRSIDYFQKAIDIQSPIVSPTTQLALIEREQRIAEILNLMGKGAESLKRYEALAPKVNAWVKSDLDDKSRPPRQAFIITSYMQAQITNKQFDAARATSVDIEGIIASFSASTKENVETKINAARVQVLKAYALAKVPNDSPPSVDALNKLSVNDRKQIKMLLNGVLPFLDEMNQKKITVGGDADIETQAKDLLKALQ